jgi:hypothetical protein
MIFLYLYLIIGISSSIFYFFDIVLDKIKAKQFKLDHIIVLLLAFLLPPVFWFIRWLVSGHKF